MNSTPRRLIEALYRELAQLTPDRSTVEGIVRAIVAAEPRMRWLIRVVLVEGYLKSARETAKRLMEEGARFPKADFVPPVPPIFNRMAFPGDRPAPFRFPGIEAASEWLNSRLIVTGDELRDLDSQAASAAFQIARVTTREGVAKIRDTVTDTIRNGKTLKEFHEDVAGVVDDVFSPAQVETLFRTNVGLAQAAGQRAVIEHPAVESEFPYLMWTASHDSRVRPEHLAMETFGQNGTAVYRLDDPMWDTLWPPCAWNCVLPGTKVEGNFVGAVRSFYHGKAVKIVTKRGSVIRVTSKHPILTKNGWINAGTVKKGDKLFRHIRHREVVGDLRTLMDANSRTTKINNSPTPIEEVFGSFAAKGFSEHRRAKGSNFHGEAEFFKGNVEAIWSDKRLLRNRKTFGSNHLGHVGFKKSGFGSMGGNGLIGPLTVGHSLPLDIFGFGLTAKLDADLMEIRRNNSTANAGSFRDAINRVASDVKGLDFGDVRQLNRSARGLFLERDRLSVIPEFYTVSRKDAPQPRFADTDMFGKAANGFAGIVSGNNVFNAIDLEPNGQKIGLTHGPDFYTGKFHMPPQNRSASPYGFSQVVHCDSALIETDEVVEVVDFEWRGHVYDLQSMTGVIVAESLIIGNCRCNVIPLTVEDAARHGSEEARKWLKTGMAPIQPYWVKPPYPIVPPKGWPVHKGIMAVA